MTPHLVALSQFPPQDLAAAARALVTCCGGTLGDRTVQLRRCRGILADNLPQDLAQAMAAALLAAHCPAWALPAAAIPALPRPVTARSLDARDAEHLKAQVHFSGPPELLAWRHIVALLPARWQVTQVAEERAPAKRQNFATTAFDVATTGGMRTLLKKPSGDKTGKRIESVQSDAMLEIVALQPLRRIHAFANRMDHGPLAGRGLQGADNWKLLLQALHDRTRLETVGRAWLEAELRAEPLPASLTVQDQNDLGRTTRWLLILATLEKRGQRA